MKPWDDREPEALFGKYEKHFDVFCFIFLGLFVGYIAYQVIRAFVI